MISKYVKPYIGMIVLVIALIVFQALSELSLPEYMSNIVNIGIGQSGVERGAPEAIRKSEMEGMFPKGSDIYSYYTLVEKSSSGYSEDYPAVMNEDLYIINDFSDEYLVLAESSFISAFENEITDSKALAINFIVNEYREIGVDLSKMQTNYIFRSGGIMLIIAVLSGAAAVLASLNSTRVAAGFARDLRKAVFTKVMSFSNSEFDKFSTASLITRSTNDIQQLQMFLGMGLRIVVFAPAMGIGAIYKVVTTQSELTWILAAAVGVIIVVVAVLFLVTSKRFRKIQELTDSANRVIREALSGILVIRAFSNQKVSEERFDEVNFELSKTNRFITRTMGAMNPIMSLTMNLAIVAIIFFGARYVENGIIQVGSIMAFIQYSTHVVMSFLFISMISIFLPRAMVSISRVREVLSSDISIKDPETTEEFDESKKGLVEFKDVSFQYSDADECVINNISFTAHPGQTTALIGTTGSGKSTVINLIPRLYDTTMGEILVDGVNVKNVKIEDLRRKISYAPQKGILFSGTIESNIKFSGEDYVSDDGMIKAAKTAQAEEFILGKEDGYKSDIAQGGTNVSGGQRQRISIARALAKPSEIVIFDDSFSALDYKTDAKLRQALKNELSDKTIILVAQRIATIRNAEKILVMDEGRIVGEGTHDKLMKDCEVYRQIASSQLGQEVS